MATIYIGIVPKSLLSDLNITLFEEFFLVNGLPLQQKIENVFDELKTNQTRPLWKNSHSYIVDFHLLMQAVH